MLFMRVSSFIFKVTRWAAFKVRGCHTKNKSKAKCARWTLFLWICVALYTGRERELVVIAVITRLELWTTNLQLLLRETCSCFSQAEESELCFINSESSEAAAYNICLCWQWKRPWRSISAPACEKTSY